MTSDWSSPPEASNASSARTGRNLLPPARRTCRANAIGGASEPVILSCTKSSRASSMMSSLLASFSFFERIETMLIRLFLAGVAYINRCARRPNGHKACPLP